MGILKKNIAISESGFIFNPETGESFTVNEIGLEVLKMLREEKKYEEILEMMVLQYDVTEIMFERYYLDFTKSLELENFLEN